MITLVQADSLSIPLADNSVHCVVTSPPYWGLRNYGIEGQLGLEKTLEEYVERMVEVFREVKRVMHPSGTVWLNLGDSYAGSGGVGNQRDGANKGNMEHFKNPNSLGITKSKRMERGNGRWGGGNLPVTGLLKPKDMVGIPWRVALALQADGWWLRSDIIWSKPNPMSESVTDRPTKEHEYIFLLSKKRYYFYDQEAIREERLTVESKPRPDGIIRDRLFEYDSKESILRERVKNLQTEGKAYSKPMTMHIEREMARNGTNIPGHSGNYNSEGILIGSASGRNKRTVWEISTQPYKGAHYATYPEALVEPCVKAGSSEKGCCPKCGAPWKRIVKAEGGNIGQSWHSHQNDLKLGHRCEIPQNKDNPSAPNRAWENGSYKRIDLGWQPTCTCDAGDPVPCTILDPFVGSGTTLLVARRLGRNAVGLDLSFSYLHEQARKRLGLDRLKDWEEGKSLISEGKQTEESELPLLTRVYSNDHDYRSPKTGG